MSNLLYFIPVTITSSLLFNEIYNNPLDIWCEDFPQKIPFSIYKQLYYTFFFGFMALSFEPITTSITSKLRSIALIILTALYVSTPVVFRAIYDPALQGPFGILTVAFGFKMLMWVKKNICFDNKEQFRSYFYTLFHWRVSSVYYLPKPKGYTFPTVEEVNLNILNVLKGMFIRWIFFEILIVIYHNAFSDYELPTTHYHGRVIEFIKNGTPFPLSFTYFMCCTTYLFTIYLYMEMYYDKHLLVSGIILKLILHYENSFGSNSTTLNNIKEWCTSLNFFAKRVYNQPFLSSSPKEFWSVRLQGMFTESFKELAYLPLMSLLNNRVVAVIGVFLLSGGFHEYVLFVQYNNFSSEEPLFFLMHGIVLLLWDAVCDKKINYKEIDDTFTWERIRKIILWNLIFFLTMPMYIQRTMASGQFVPEEFSAFSFLPDVQTKILNYRQLRQEL